MVDNTHTETRCRLTKLTCIEHCEILVDSFYSDVSIVGNMEVLAAALLCSHLYYARCTSATILGCLGSVFQNGKTLDVGRIDGRKRGDV